MTRRGRVASPMTWPVLLAAALILAGCSLFDSGQPERIRVQLEGSGGQAVRLVLSRDFILFPGEGGGGVSVQLTGADTLVVTPPFDRSFDLAPSYRFYTRAEALEEDSPPTTLRLRVTVDGEERYNQSRSVPADFLQFIYVFQ